MGVGCWGQQFDFPRTFPPFESETLAFSADVPWRDVPDPVRWYMVLQGNTGPGVQEAQAILTNTDVAAWFYQCTG